jgi:hypothetical protein
MGELQTMSKHKRLLIAEILGATMLVAGVVAASADVLAVRWYAITGGGGRSSLANYVVHGSAGQPAAGTISSAGYRLSSGFWAGAAGAVVAGTPTATRTAPAPTASATSSGTPTRQVTPGATATRTATARSRVWLPVMIRR